MYLKLFYIVFLFHYTRSDVLDLTCSDVRAFVDGHNSRRLQIVKGEIDHQPPAGDMKYMTWDNELAEKAAKWASYYTTQQDPDTSIGSGRFFVYQNTEKDVNYFPNPEHDIDAVLDKWFTQYKNYVFGPYGYSESNNENYIKMIRSNSKYIGCAVSQKSNEGLGIKTYYTVCNYGPSFSDDYKYGEPYETGPKDDKLQCDSSECNHPYGYSCS